MAEVTLEQAMRVAYEHQQAGRFGQAEGIYRQLLSQDPGLWRVMGVLSRVLTQTGRHEEAIKVLLQAVAIEPNDVTLVNHLGIAYTRVGRMAEAVPCFRRVLELEPDDAQAHYNFAKVIKDTGQLDEAAAALHEAIRLSPTLFEAYENLGNIYKDQAQVDKAIALYREATALRPHDSHRYANQLYSLTFHPDYDQAAILKAHEAWDERVCRPLRANVLPHENDASPGRRLRIGYVGAYFRNHCQSFFTVPLLSHHDHKQFEIFCYSDLAGGDAITDKLRGYTDQWRNTLGLTDEQMARGIRSDKIDILVDLTMHMAGNRLAVFARRPAPVQVTWLAYPGTTGTPAIDYRFSDPNLDPDSPEIDALYAERTWRLPDTFWCYDPLATEPAVNELPALSAGHITFGCLNNFCKVSDRTLELWAGVLQKLPGARLILLSEPGSHRQRTVDFLAARGVNPTCVEWVGPVAREEYLRRYHRIDIGLDTVPYNGHTTSLDSFWMGVPVVTLVGTTVVGRAGLSQLTNLGLPELIARTPEEYVEIVTRLAGDLERLKKLRGGLRGRMASCALGDGARLARNVEMAYCTMWERWCSEPRRESSPARPPREFDERIKVAMQHHQANRLAQAEACYRQILAETPDHCDALHYLGVLHGENGRYDLAVELINKAIALDPTQARLHGSIGSYYARQSKYEEAERALRRAIELQPDCPDAHSNLGAVLKKKGDLEGAYEMLSLATQIHPTSADAHFNLGTFLLGAQRFEESINCFTRALAINPRHESAQHNLNQALQLKRSAQQSVAAK